MAIHRVEKVGWLRYTALPIYSKEYNVYFYTTRENNEKRKGELD